MALSTKLKNIFDELSEEAKKKLTRMAWDDGTSMKDIEKAFSLSANQVEKFMRYQLSDKDYKRWKNRLSKRTHKKGKPVHRLYELQNKDEF